MKDQAAGTAVHLPTNPLPLLPVALCGVRPSQEAVGILPWDKPLFVGTLAGA